MRKQFSDFIKNSKQRDIDDSIIAFRLQSAKVECILRSQYACYCASIKYLPSSFSSSKPMTMMVVMMMMAESELEPNAPSTVAAVWVSHLFHNHRRRWSGGHEHSGRHHHREARCRIGGGDNRWSLICVGCRLKAWRRWWRIDGSCSSLVRRRRPWWRWRARYRLHV